MSFTCDSSVRPKLFKITSGEVFNVAELSKGCFCVNLICLHREYCKILKYNVGPFGNLQTRRMIFDVVCVIPST